MRLVRGVRQSDPSPSPATTSTLAKTATPPPAPKPLALRLVVKSWSLIFPPQLTQFMSPDGMLQVVRLGRGVYQSDPSPPPATTSMLAKITAPPLAPKPQDQRLAAN